MTTAIPVRIPIRRNESAPTELSGLVLEAKRVLDGIHAFGKSWNMVSIKWKGNTRVNVGDLVLVQHPKKFKGLFELRPYTNVLSLSLAAIGNMDLLLLLCTNEDKIFKGKNLSKIRTSIVEAIRKSIHKLPDTSITKKDNEFRIDDSFFIHDQEDWEKVGDFLPEEIGDIHKCQEMVEQPELVKLVPFWKNVEVFFTLYLCGQENIFQPNEKLIFEQIMDKKFSCLRTENLLRLVVHCATDYKTCEEDSSTKLLVPNSEYISSQFSQQHCDYYCPFLSIPGFGNVRYSFQDPEEGMIHGFQVYLRWTNYMKHNRFKLFRELYIAKRLAAMTRSRFQFKMEKDSKTRKEIFVKPRTDKDKEILSYRVVQLLRDMLGFLERQIEVRVEVVHSTLIKDDATIGELIKTAFDDSEDWLDKKRIGMRHQPEMFSHMEKESVLDWANHHMLPCINTLEKMIEKTNNVLDAPTVLDIPATSFWSNQDYHDVCAAEKILIFFLNGMIPHKTTARGSEKETTSGTDVHRLSYFGFDIKNRQGVFLLKNVDFVNGFIMCNNSNHMDAEQKWITLPQVQFLREIVTSIKQYEITNKDNTELMCIAVLGYAMAYEGDSNSKNGANIIFSKDKLDLQSMITKSILTTNQQPTKTHKDSVVIEREVIAIPELVNMLLESGSFGSFIVPYVLNLLNTRMKKLNNAWDITTYLEKYLHNELLKQQIPIVFLIGGVQYKAGIPFGPATYPLVQMMPLVKSTCLWYQSRLLNHKWTENELVYFRKFQFIFSNLKITLRSTVKVDKLIQLSVYMMQGKVKEANDVIAEILALFDPSEEHIIEYLEQLKKLIK